MFYELFCFPLLLMFERITVTLYINLRQTQTKEKKAKPKTPPIPT